ncbi:MAG: ImmA/IrrE family metallo-endopeptidase [Gammaproteobacteria bacterium]|nr:ImmA/IrrE family metallo-endopeptidase [Gammaproteobacteria bacterium]
MTITAVSTAASEIHRLIWNSRDAVWPLGAPQDPVDMLDPRVAVELLGYTYVSVPEIFDWPPNTQSAIAGIVDPGRKRITVSQRFGFASARFTGAHELGHIVLDSPKIAFRERSIRAPREHIRDPVERRADRFAASFLMPENLVKQRAAEAFGTLPIEVNDAMAFLLDSNEPERLLRANPDSRERAFALARCSRDILGNHIISLHKQFKVSVEAMAYRLDELELIRRYP